MKKILSFIFIPLWIISFILTTIFIIIVNTIFTYNYPYNNFTKIANTMSLSKNHRNLIYIMTDMTTGLDITSILQSNPILSNNFTGFTNYENLIATSWGTNGSVPNIFGGYDYNPYYKNHGSISNLTFRQYMKNAMNVLLSAFGESNWDISCVANQYYNYNSTKSYWDSDWQALENDFSKYHVKAINANDISRLLYYKNPQLYHKLNLPNRIFQQSSNVNFIPIIPYLSQANISNTDNDKFIEIMNESTHSPVVMDEFGNYKSSSENPFNLYQDFKGFITQISNLINYLKVNNIYNNTMIVINSDHGNINKSLVLSDPSYNHSGIDYSAINQIANKYSDISRYLPTLLVKPYNNNNPITYNNSNLYTNTDILSFIKEYNKDQVNFNVLDQTKDIRYLKQLSDINLRNNVYMPSYGNDTLWNDNFTHYLLPNSGYGSNSYLVKNSIYNLNNWLVSKNLSEYYQPDDLSNWKSI